MTSGHALFYPVSIAQQELLGLVLGHIEEPPDEVVEFSAQEGGDAVRELGVPFLPDMDEVRVDEARLVLRSRARQLDVDGYSVTATTGADAGIVVSLQRLGRIRKLELSYPTFAAAVAADARRFQLLGGKVESRPTGEVIALRVVARPATRQGSGFSFGPPAFAEPAFAAPGPLYGPVLAGLSVRDLGNSRWQIGLPAQTPGDWLIQLAHGSGPTELQPVAFSATVNRLTVDALTADLSLAITAPEGDVELWSNPGDFLPELGNQEVNFTPLAQNFLAKRLQTAPPDSQQLTMALPLRLHSATAGDVAIQERVLSARYLVHPLGPEATTLRIGGSLTPLALKAPAGLTPVGSSTRLTARHQGRELNTGSPRPPADAPASGARVNQETWVATPLQVEARDGAAEGSVMLASARVFCQADADAELVLELRRDAAGAPAGSLAPAVVRRLARGAPDWLEFELASPAGTSAGERLWVLLRTTKGEVLWFAYGVSDGRMSTDRGETWAAIDSGLLPAGRPLAQLFHVVPDPVASPRVELWLGDRVIEPDLLVAAKRLSEREFAIESAVLPAAVHQALGTADGAGDRPSFSLFSTAVADLTLEGLALFYDPYTSRHGASA